jgi:DNA repair protein RecN (Recombination protein N)
MLAELVVSDLGVIEHAALLLADGMTALTGETGAGKTLVVEAIQLLLGGRADPVLVRAGAAEARVDGRFLVGDGEVVLSRVVPRAGRSRAYIDGRPVPAAVLAELGQTLVDLHGQHGHQTLLSAGAQREALDLFGGIDLGPLQAARAELRRVAGLLAEMGGDERARAREADLIRFQVRELDDASLSDPEEDKLLEAEEDALSGSVTHREAAAAAVEALAADGGARDGLAAAIATLTGLPPFSAQSDRLRSVAVELEDATAEVRRIGERIEDDPARLSAVRARRQRLRELCRKYGDDLAAVIAFADEARARLDELLSHDERAAELARTHRDALRALDGHIAEVNAARRAVTPSLAAAIEERLGALAMPKARISVEVATVADAGHTGHPDTGHAEAAVDRRGDGDGEVTFLLAANPGSPALPLSKVASGGELARIMLALRLALLESPSSRSPNAGPASRPVTLVFDEVDAGIGGQAAVAVGRALADLAVGRQVLVVTHLPQVAAFADQQVLVRKDELDGRTVTGVGVLDQDGRVAELARMLSGRPDSATAREHAQELLDSRLRSGPRAAAAPRRRAGAALAKTATRPPRRRA